MPARSRGVLLSEIDHRKPADPTGPAGLEVVELHAARHYLVVATADIPNLSTAERGRVVLDQVDEYTARGVNSDDRLRGQVHELDHLGVRGLLECVGYVVR